MAEIFVFIPADAGVEHICCLAALFPLFRSLHELSFHSVLLKLYVARLYHSGRPREGVKKHLLFADIFENLWILGV